MAEFDVKIDSLNQAANGFDGQISRYSEIQSEIFSVQLELLRYLVSMHSVRSKLRTVRGRLGDEKKHLGTMRTVLRDSVVLYANADKFVMSSSDGIMNGDAINASNDELLSTPTEEMDAFIEEFERENPGVAEKFNTFLSGGKNNQITADDIRNIKYLAYNAKEPYRTIYLNSLSKFKIGNADLNNGAYYKPFFHTLNYTYPENFLDDPRGAYTTIFHECGHAIDDLSEESQWWGSDTENFKTYNEAMGKEVTLREAISYDVYYNKDNPHSITSIANDVISSGGGGSKGNIDNVIKAFQSGNSDGLGKDDLMLYNAVRDQFKRTTGPTAAYESVSDVYGGMTGNELVTGYYHPTSYWGDSTMAGKELWAEFFSYNMAGDDENLKNLLYYFPEASKVCQAYADALVS